MKDSCNPDQKTRTFRELVRTSAFWLPVAGVGIGALAGFLYYYFVGCASGTCAITSSPYISTLYGALLGLFISNRPCKTC